MFWNVGAVVGATPQNGDMPQLTATHLGSWRIRVNGTGAVVTSDEATFEVLATEFATPLP